MPHATVCRNRSSFNASWFWSVLAVAASGCAVAPSFDEAQLVTDADGGVSPTSGNGDTADDGGGASLDSTDAAASGDATTASSPDGGTAAPKKDAGTGAGTGPDAGSAPDTAAPPPPGATKPAPGEVIISEVMYDPSGTEPDGEWLELYNTAASPRLVSGLTLKDGSDRTHTIAGSVVIAAGAYVIMVRSTSAATAAKVPAAAIAYEYGAGLSSTTGILLANGSSGALFLFDGSTQIAQAPYGGWFNESSPGGKSVQLQRTTGAGAGSASAWCLSTSSWSSGSDDGTPGAASNCP